MALKIRIEKLERRYGVTDDWMDRDKHPCIGVIYDPKEDGVSEEIARSNAVAKWESKNGPLGDRKPFFIVREIVTPEPRTE